jgi:hypothetical protein
MVHSRLMLTLLSQIRDRQDVQVGRDGLSKSPISARPSSDVFATLQATRDYGTSTTSWAGRIGWVIGTMHAR